MAVSRGRARINTRLLVTQVPVKTSICIPASFGGRLLLTYCLMVASLARFVDVQRVKFTKVSDAAERALERPGKLGVLWQNLPNTKTTFRSCHHFYHMFTSAQFDER